MGPDDETQVIGEKDPYPVDALPTCNHALSVCQQERKCIKLFDDFKSNCKVRDQKCRMEDRDLCHEAWTKLRLSPMFGCICPNNHMKRRCDRIFTMVNHNPCVDVLPASLDLSGTDSALYPYDPEQGNFRELWYPSLYPYFLSPPSSHQHPQPPLEEPQIDYDDSETKLTASYSGSISVKVISSENATSFDGIESQLENPLVGIRGANQKDYNGVRQEVQWQGNGNSSLFDEDGEPRRTSLTQYQGKSSDAAAPAAAAEPRNLSLQSTCHVALAACQRNASCRARLQPVLAACDPAPGRCHRHTCMDKLQDFYRQKDLLPFTLEIAFCLCKKTENKQDECLVAQEKLHPVCAQRVDGQAMPTCHSLAELCREQRSCRNRLESYEQSCAVDSVTKKCAGPASECRHAMLAILGTELRSNCACKGTDFTQLYDCLGWQRLLWVNPCVVESQKDFHTKRLSESAATSAATTTATPAAGPPPTAAPAPAAAPTSAPSPSTPAAATASTPTPTPASSTASTSTTLPPRYCVVHRPQQSVQYIREGKGKRLYQENEPDCSELCQCSEGEQLVCNTVCVERAPCKTEFAFYNHAAPSYQAYRGRCLCYSGRFICMRPILDGHKLPQGVFLFLGYSEADEQLLRPHSNLTVRDAVASLEEFMHQQLTNKTSCTLSLYNVTKENLILVAKLKKDDSSAEDESSQISSADLLVREKEECAGPLQELSSKINARHPELHSHLLLSIFKMAEVEVKVPEGGGARPAPPVALVLLAAALALRRAS